MSEENVELIKGFLSAYEGLDLAAFWRDTNPADMRAIFEAVYDPAIEIVWVDTNPIPDPSTASTKRCGHSTSGWRLSRSSS